MSVSIDWEYAQDGKWSDTERRVVDESVAKLIAFEAGSMDAVFTRDDGSVAALVTVCAVAEEGDGHVPGRPDLAALVLRRSDYDEYETLWAFGSLAPQEAGR